MWSWLNLHRVRERLTDVDDATFDLIEAALTEIGAAPHEPRGVDARCLKSIADRLPFSNLL